MKMNENLAMALTTVVYLIPFVVTYVAQQKLLAHPDSQPWKIVFWVFLVISILFFLPIAGQMRYIVV